jgi:hypothetical protein
MLTRPDLLREEPGANDAPTGPGIDQHGARNAHEEDHPEVSQATTDPVPGETVEEGLEDDGEAVEEEEAADGEKVGAAGHGPDAPMVQQGGDGKGAHDGGGA